MEKIKVGSYPKDTLQPPIMETEDEWEGLSYRPNPDCPRCRGTGFVHPMKSDGRPDYTQMVVCREPRCLLTSIRGGEVDQTFANFGKVRGTEQAFKYAKELSSGDSAFIWLLIYGFTGCGKTHLCNAVMRQVRDRGIEVQLISSADLFAELRLSMENHSTEEHIKHFKQVSFLLIDDWGVEYGSEWEKAKFDEIMTSRFATGRCTVLAMNKDIEQLPERIKSRFNDKRLSRSVHNSAGDYRKNRR